MLQLMTNPGPPRYFIAAPAQHLLDRHGGLIAPMYCQQQIGAGYWLPELSCDQGLCRACRRETVVIDDMPAEQLRAALSKNPRRCFATVNAVPSWTEPYYAPALLTPLPEALPKIRCVRSVALANSAIKEGFYPVMVCVVGALDPQCSTGILVRQNEDGTVKIHRWLDESFTACEFMECEPFEASIFDTSNPFYAYLVPRGLPAGSRVWIAQLAHPVLERITNDYIEPLQSCEAIWNGEDLDFLLPRIKQRWVIG